MRAAIWGGESEAKLAGLLHDMGKYTVNFQKRLDGKMRGVNHWSQGAYWAGKLKWTPSLGQQTAALRWFIRVMGHQAASANVLAV